MFPVGKQICQQLVVLNKSAFAERNFKQTGFIRIIPWMGFLRIIHWCRKLSAMKIRFNLSSPEFMELQKLISEKKKSGRGNKRESLDLTGGNFGEGQPSCYKRIEQPSFGLFNTSHMISVICRMIV